MSKQRRNIHLINFRIIKHLNAEKSYAYLGVNEKYVLHNKYMARLPQIWRSSRHHKLFSPSLVSQPLWMFYLKMRKRKRVVFSPVENLIKLGQINILPSQPDTGGHPRAEWTAHLWSSITTPKRSHGSRSISVMWNSPTVEFDQVAHLRSIRRRSRRREFRRLFTILQQPGILATPPSNARPGHLLAKLSNPFFRPIPNRHV